MQMIEVIKGIHNKLSSKFQLTFDLIVMTENRMLATIHVNKMFIRKMTKNPFKTQGLLRFKSINVNHSSDSTNFP